MTTPTPNPTILYISPAPHQIDVAVISHQFKELRRKSGKEHIVELDVVNISLADFKYLFYYTSNNNDNTFAVNQNYPTSPNDLDAYFKPFITFNKQKVNGKLFKLSDTILDHVESDLGISRHMISTCSLITITKELNAIKTLCDLNSANVPCSLKWSDITQTLRNMYENSTIPDPVEAILTISVVFVTPNEGVSPTVVKFNYKINVSL
jgi:hypothetical protein